MRGNFEYASTVPPRSTTKASNPEQANHVEQMLTNRKHHPRVMETLIHHIVRPGVRHALLILFLNDQKHCNCIKLQSIMAIITIPSKEVTVSDANGLAILQE